MQIVNKKVKLESTFTYHKYFQDYKIYSINLAGTKLSRCKHVKGNRIYFHLGVLEKIPVQREDVLLP